MENQFEGNASYGQPPVYNGQAPQPVFNAPPAPFLPFFGPDYREKWFDRAELRRRTRVAVIPMLILMLAFSMFSSFLINTLIGLGVSRESLSSFFGDPAISSVYSVVLACFFFGVPFALSAKLSGFRISELVPYGVPKKGTVLPMLLLGISFCGFANIMSGIADNFFSGLGFEYSLPESDVPQGALGFAVSVLSTAVEPGLMEEFAMRGITLGLFRRWGDGFAIIVSAVLFGLMHGNFTQIPFAFLVGLVLGYIRIKTGSLWIACAVHAINNFISVLFDYIPSSAAANMWYVVYLMACMLFGLIALLLMNGRSISPELEKGSGKLSTGVSLKTVFCHPLTVIFIIFCLLESIAYWEPVLSLIQLFAAG